jgi:transcriptional regulator with XRE-family HTH domain
MAADHFIRQWREIRGLSLREVEMLGDEELTYASISRIERGEQPYSEKTLKALAQVYQVEPWVLLSVNPLKHQK